MVTEKDLKAVEEWRNRIRQEGRFRILPVPGTFMFDLFKDGVGWCHHSRVNVWKNTRKVVQGEAIPQAILWRLFPL